MHKRPANLVFGHTLASSSITLSVIGLIPFINSNISRTALMAGAGAVGGIVGGGAVVVTLNQRSRQSARDLDALTDRLTAQLTARLTENLTNKLSGKLTSSLTDKLTENVQLHQADPHQLNTIHESTNRLIQNQNQLAQRVKDLPNRLQQRLSSDLTKLDPIYEQITHLVHDYEQLSKELESIRDQVSQSPVHVPVKPISPPEPLQTLPDILKPSAISPNIVDPDGEVDSEPEDIQEVLAWFEAHHVTVANLTPQQATGKMEEQFNDIAIFLGKHYNYLEPLYKQIKRNYSGQSRPVILNLKDDPQKQRKISLGTQLCKKLKDAALLTSPRYYFSNEKLFRFTLTPEADARRFFEGIWFEYFITDQVIGILNRRDLSYQYLKNAKVTPLNADEFELDLFFIVEGKSLWIECKAGGDYDAFLRKYSQRRDLLALPASRSFLVILELEEDLADLRTERYGITVVNRHNVVQKIEALFDSVEDLSPVEEPASPNHLSELGTTTNLQELAAFKGIQPLPDCRSLIISTLIQLFSNIQEPQSFNQIKNILFQKLADTQQLSRRKLESILRVIHLSRCFLDHNREPILSFGKPIAALKSLDPDYIEMRCIERYARQVLFNDITFFDQPENIQYFERFVGGQAPDPTRIDRIKEELQQS